MFKKTSGLLKPILISGVFLFAAGVSFSADKAAPQKEPAPPPYDRTEAIKTIINPHEQINDEGEVLWGTCTVCHKNVPDMKEEKSIKDVKLHFEEDPNKLCTDCHTVKQHPGSEGISATMSGFVAPDHLVVPSKSVQLNMKLSLKEVAMVLPLDPKSGKLICSTCHNPHERGLLTGRADHGADFNLRLRSASLDICMYCHRK